VYCPSLPLHAHVRTIPESVNKPEANNESDYRRPDAAENVKVFGSFGNATFFVSVQTIMCQFQ
jgi:hypothetical protein